MSTRLTKLMQILLIVCCISFLTATLSNAQPVHRVLIEEITGQWCGNCPDGASIMQGILTKYPGQVLGAAWHGYAGRDAMFIPEQDTLCAAFGISGYPSGIISRSNQYPPVNRTSWETYCLTEMAIPAVCDIVTYYTYNAGSRNLIVKLNVTFTQSMSGDYRLNAYILESDINLPQTSAPSSYRHNHVVRAVLGSLWGQTGSLPSSINAGTKYSYTFNYTVPSDFVWENITIVGVVQQFDASSYGNRPILNCVEGIAGEPNLEMTSSDPGAAAKNKSESFQKSFDIKNPTQLLKTYTITTGKSTRTPSDWTVSLTLPPQVDKNGGDSPQADEITLAAGATKTVTLKLTVGTTIGLGDATIQVREKNNSASDIGDGTLTIVSKEIDQVQVIDDGETGKYSLTSVLNSVNQTGFYEIPSADFVPVYSQMTNVKNLIWTCGEEGKISNDEAAGIKSFIDAGKGVLLTGTTIAQYLNLATPNVLNSIGTNVQGPCFQGQGTGSIQIIGYKDDPITNGIDKNGSLIKYLTFALGVSSVNTHPILRFKNVDTVIAVRATTTKGNVVLLGLNPFSLDQTTRNNLISKSMRWIKGQGAQIAVDNPSIDFGEVAKNSTKDEVITLSNSGDEALTVTDISAEYEMSNIFVNQTTVPFTIGANGTKDVTIRFKPNYETNFTSVVTITSNAMNNSKLTFNVTGKGIPAGSAPKISSDKTTLDFGDVQNKDNKILPLVISNTGQADLNITAITIPAQYSSIFTTDATLPLTIAKSGNKTINVTFAPDQETAFNANMTIASNDPANANYTIALQGNGVPSDVFEIGNNGQFKLELAPNPVSDKAVIRYSYTGSNPQMIEMNIVDLNGNIVSHLFNSQLTTGTFIYDLYTNELSSGKYFVSAKINGKTMTIPFVVVK